MKSKKKRNLMMPYAGADGRIYEAPHLQPAFRTGKRFVSPDIDDLIKLPYGSYLFSLPGRHPVYKEKNKFIEISTGPDNREIFAVSSFLSSAYLRTYLPAYSRGKDAPDLSLWAYAASAIIDGEFYAPAIRIDDDPRSDPEIHQNHAELDIKIRELSAIYSENRLVKQLARCSTEYGCLCARNFFLSRYEAPVPTSPACNADCAGCISQQPESSGFSASHARLNFKPSPDEISEVILHHFSKVENAVASFGQGCEGEPLLRADDIAEAIKRVRAKTELGTININTNGSITNGVKNLIDAGLDSIRISLNSPTEKYYTGYHRPIGYTYRDVLNTLDAALNAGIFISLNLFFMPGFTDSESEVKSLYDFLKKFPVNMIQTRNMNIDPDIFFDLLNIEDSEPMGIRNLVNSMRENFPNIRLGYYNPPKEKFHIKP